MRGTLFLIVGPSGAGKDTLIAAARATLDERFVFPRRVITRPATAGGEDHHAIDQAAFTAREQAHAFALTWRAHGLAYGVPASIAADLHTGRHVVVNVSRAAVAEARARFQPARVVLITAPPEVLRQRLLLRGREARPDVDARLERAVDVAADCTIVNDGATETAVRALLAVLQG